MSVMVNRQRGVTLIELIIALGLGAFLALGVVNVFVGNSTTSRVEKALSSVQQGSRTALDFVVRDIRRSGYYGCSTLSPTINVNFLAKDSLSGYPREERRFEAFSANGSSLVPDPTNKPVALIRALARRGTDVIALDYSNYLGSDLIVDDDGEGFVQDGVDTLELRDRIEPFEQRACDLGAGDLVIVSDCKSQSFVLEISAVSGCDTSEERPSNTLSFAVARNDNPVSTVTAQNPTGVADMKISSGDEIAELRTVMWYVADTGRDRDGQDIFALYRLFADQPVSEAEEILEGVEYMRVEVGQRVGTGLRFVTPTAANIDWDAIEAVRIAIMVQSTEAVAEENDTEVYQMLGQKVGPGETFNHSGGRVIRRVFTTSQAIRNSDFGV